MHLLSIAMQMALIPLAAMVHSDGAREMPESPGPVGAGPADATGKDAESEVGDSPVACSLHAGPFASRLVEVRRLFAGHVGMTEKEDGYAFEFPGDGEWDARLMEFIRTERGCCSFFRFELLLEPNQGPIWLSISGSREVKAFLSELVGT